MAQQLFPEFQVIIVPGLHDSSVGHWQTRWHRAHPDLPAASLARPSLLIGSRDDPWMRAGHAAAWARRWAAESSMPAPSATQRRVGPRRLAHRIGLVAMIV